MTKLKLPAARLRRTQLSRCSEFSNVTLSLVILGSLLAMIFASSGNLYAVNYNSLNTAGPEHYGTLISKEWALSPLLERSEYRNGVIENGDTAVPLLNTGETEITLYLRDKGILSETIGDPIPWVIRYVYPSQTTSIEWETTLGGDITGAFYYQIDVVECETVATIRIEFIVDQDGIFTVVADQLIDLAALPSGYYTPLTGDIVGTDLQTQDGDKLIFRVTHVSGANSVGVGLDGTAEYNDSRIKIVHHGPIACFTANPIEGDLLTQFNVDASCSYDSEYPTANLQVRWDWENDGDYDTQFTTLKTASHQYYSSGIKFIKLQVKNPDPLTGTEIHEISIPIVVVDSFDSPGSAPAGITWDGTHLWLSDVGSDTIHELTPSGQGLGSFAAPCGDPMDMAWDGTHLCVLDAWGSDNKGNLLYKVDTSGIVVGNPVQVPVDIATGLTWDGHFFWGADGTNGIIRKLDPVTGVSIASFRSPGYDPRGLAWDGQNLWNADFSDQKIYQFDVNGRLLNTWKSPGSGPMGLTWDGKYLWCVDLNSYRVYKLGDKIPTTITCELTQSSVIIGEILTISGHITPSPCAAGIGISIELIPPVGVTVYEAALADINGEFDYTIECDDICRAGTWNVRTSWAGSGPFEGSTSGAQALEVSKATTRLTLDVTSQAIKLGDPVSISGKFTPEPDCGADLSGIPITLVISGPGGPPDIQNIQTGSLFGHFLLEDYNGFNALGVWTVTASFSGNDAYLPSTSSTSGTVEVQVVETAGYAIVVQGKIASEEGLDSHNKTAQFVYDKLIERGLLPDDIMYFNYDFDNPARPEIDALPTEEGIEDAVTDWAVAKMNAVPANLYIVTLDHGLEDVFYIYPYDITAAELATWLDTLQSGVTGQAAEQEIITILGFCRSGSLIDDLSGTNRVIIASAASDESSYKGPLDEDGIREGEYFISEFFKKVSFGKSVKECFEHATALTEVFTSSGTGESTNAPYYDDSLQHPLLDDNGDGEGTNDLSNPDGDGLLSEDLFIGVSSITGNDPGDIMVIETTGTQFLGLGEDTVDLWAGVDDNSGFSTIWVEVKPPDFVIGGSGGSGQAYLDLTKTPTTDYSSGDNRWEWSSLGGFSEPGPYQVFYFAKDNVTGNVSSLMETRVYKATSPNSAPDAFDLVSPADGTEVLTTFILDWQGTTDPDGDSFTYTILLSEDDDLFSNPIKKEGLKYSSYFMNSGDGIEDLTDYFWKVQAIDEYGAVQETGVSQFGTNNTNPTAAWVEGCVYDCTTGVPIANAIVSVASQELGTELNGYYVGTTNPGIYTIFASAAGYIEKSYPGVVFPDGGIVTRDFGLEPEETSSSGALSAILLLLLGE